MRYAVEGSIFVAGSAVKWLRDKAGLLENAAASEEIAADAAAAGAYLVPAFAGLGAPHWNPQARAALVGMSLDTGAAQIVRAALEGVAFQTVDLADAFADSGLSLTRLRVDGGMAANNLFVQMLADYLALPVERPRSHETHRGRRRIPGRPAGRLLCQPDRHARPVAGRPPVRAGAAGGRAGAAARRLEAGGCGRAQARKALIAFSPSLYNLHPNGAHFPAATARSCG